MFKMESPNDINTNEIPRVSSYPLTPMPVALETIVNKLNPLPPEEVPLSCALSCVLACSVIAPAPQPPFRASIKDGYAVCTAEKPLDSCLRVIGQSVAGAGQAPRISPGLAAYVTTGAPIPPGADAVVMVEKSQPVAPGVVKLTHWPCPGEEVREIGSDVQEGQVVLEAGDRIGAAEIGILASCRISRVKVFQKVVIGVLSTGDELVDLDTNSEEPHLSFGKIVDSNRPMLLAAIRESLPFCEARDLGVVADQYKAVHDSIALALSECHVVLTTGGVSMGNRDLIKPVLEDLATVHFGRVLMKPGKPLTFATVSKGHHCAIGLPGNPVSAFVCFHLAVCAAAKRLAGWSIAKSTGSMIDVKLGHDLKLDANRPEYHRATLEVRGCLL